MAGEEFLLKWNDHHNSFFSIMQELYTSESLTDVTLACGGQVFEAHKIILCVCSSFFRSILNRRRDKAPIVFLKDIHPKHLEQLIQYMYNGEINVLQEDLAPLIEAARALQIKGLSDTPSGNGQGQQSRPPRPNAPPPAKKSKAAANKRKAESPSQIIASNHAQHQQLNYARDEPIVAPPRGGPNLKEHLEAWNASQQDQDMSQDSEYADGQDIGDEEELYLQQQQSMVLSDNNSLLKAAVTAGSAAVLGGGGGQAANSGGGGGGGSVKRHECSYCGKRFPTPSKLQRHCLIHTGEKPHLCSICMKGFTQLSHLKNHMKYSHANLPLTQISLPQHPVALPLLSDAPVKSEEGGDDVPLGEKLSLTLPASLQVTTGPAPSGNETDGEDKDEEEDGEGEESTRNTPTPPPRSPSASPPIAPVQVTMTEGP